MFTEKIVKIQIICEFTESFFAALKSNDVDTVTKRLQEGMDPDERKPRRLTPLMIAVKASHLDIVKVLVEFGGDINAIAPSGSVLMMAIKRKKLSPVPREIIDFLLSLEPDLSIKDKEGRNALECAIQYGHINVVNTLIKKGGFFSIDSKEEIFFEVIKNDWVDTAKLLLEYGADINAKNKKGWTALYTAAYRGEFDTLKLLLEYGADIEAKNEFGWTSLCFAAYRDKFDTVKFLLEHGADIEAKANNGWSALRMAARRNRLGMVNFLLEHGADAEAKGHGRKSVLEKAKLPLDEAKNEGEEIPLFTAVRYKKSDNLKMFLENGEVVDAKDFHGKTALEIAYHDISTMKVLFKYRADIDAKNSRGLTVLYEAADTSDIYEFEKYLEIVKFLVEHGADIEAKSDNGWTVLHKAIVNENLNLVKFLLEHGADIEAKAIGGRTPLLQSILGGKNLGVAQFLLELGANIKAKTNDGWTALHLAVFHYTSRLNIVELLLEHGVDIDTKNVDGSTALHVAASMHDKYQFDIQFEIVKLLLEHGADIEAKDNSGFTALQNSERLENEVMIKLLREYK